MADEKQVKPRGSCLGKLVVLIALLGVAGLGAAVYFIVTPQDLTDIKGRTSGLTAPPKAPDLAAVLKKSIEGNYPISLSEEQINLYLQQTLAAKQGGLLGEFVTMKGVRVRLEEGYAEVIMERSVMDQPLTLSMYLKIDQYIDVQGRTKGALVRGGDPYFPNDPRLEHLIRGGRFGRLEVPQGFLLLVLPAFEKLAGVYQNELHLGFEEMSRITFAEGKLVLDPRADGGDLSPGVNGTY
ncbi:hypothetical protein [Luteolibacter marinus]|uniref:hypothetical protein n=1 Tax=Luteolibacter marinus TaxID=2776705 RepID=UPI00186871EC|nr:hypothetical protein [Luteolibacter marinus]